MKKLVTVLALALASVAVLAQSAPQVSVYGKVRVYEESYTLGTASALTRLTNDTSRLGFKATGDVGSGITATAVLETGVAVDAPSATTLGDRTARFDLSNDLGSVGMGRDKHSVTRALDNFDAFNNAYGTIVGTIHNAQGSRVQNALFVSTAPVMGFTANWQLANSETAGTANTTAGSIDYTRGPFSATFARYDDGISSSSNIVGAKFVMASTGTTVFGLYSSDVASNVSSVGKSIGVSQAITSQLSAQATYGETDGGKTGRGVGVRYDMNKALAFHARYSFIDTTTDVTQYGVGVEYNF
jgi:predicted porin